MPSQPTAVRVEVPPDRLERWLTGFVERHGSVEYTASGDRLTLVAADGSKADCVVPFPPFTRHDDQPYAGLLEHVQVRRRVGVLLVRRGGYAAGVFAGSELVSSKVGSRHVQGRSKAGGWSQQRFARRRQQQAREAFAAAADVAVRVLAPEAGRLDALVCGGDRAAVDAVLSDPRLRELRPLAPDRLFAVPDPRRRVLDEMPRRFASVHITVTDQPDDPGQPVNPG